MPPAADPGDRAAPSGLSIVVPTLGRPSLDVLLRTLAAAPRPDVPLEVLLVDDRREHRTELAVPAALAGCTKVLTGRAAGPAAASSIGWRAARHPWVDFLDDDVVPEPDWLTALLSD